MTARVKLNGRDKETVAANDLVGAVATPQKLTAAQYAEAITATWQQAVASIIRTGKLLIQAKKQLRHGEFGKLFDEDKLPFGNRTAQMLMEIASHPIIGNAKHVSHLPAAWGTLHKLCQIPDPELESLLADGKINAGTERSEVEETIKKIRQHGIYRWDRLVESLKVIAEFQKKWPDADYPGEHIFDNEDLPDDLPAIGAWVGNKLDAACAAHRKREAEADAAHWAKEEEEDEDEVGPVMGYFRPQA